MNKTVRFKYLLMALAAVCTASIAQTPATPAAAASTSTDCSAAEYRQLDFWIGDWDTFETSEPGGASIARARVEPIVQGCAIRELYEQNDGLIGDAILSYDPVRRQWQQTWVTNRGSIMVLFGTFEDGVLTLEGDAHLKDGRSVRQRIRWETTDAGVREWAELSKDGGKTWAPAFDVVFRKRGPDRPVPAV